jgi:hypothetical protein
LKKKGAFKSVHCELEDDTFKEANIANDNVKFIRMRCEQLGAVVKGKGIRVSEWCANNFCL